MIYELEMLYKIITSLSKLPDFQSAFSACKRVYLNITDTVNCSSRQLQPPVAMRQQAAAATYRVTLSRVRYSLYFTVSWEMSSKLPSPVGIWAGLDLAGAQLNKSWA